jgi:hypothetical protein
MNACYDREASSEIIAIEGEWKEPLKDRLARLDGSASLSFSSNDSAAMRC